MSESNLQTLTPEFKTKPQTAVVLTPKAQEKAKRILEKEGLLATHAIRVKVVGGGCSGLSYQLVMDDKRCDKDLVLPQEAGFDVVVDDTARQYLNGTIVDYAEVFGGGGFTFKNPNAASTCGCGSSFSV